MISTFTFCHFVFYTYIQTYYKILNGLILYID